MIALLLAIPLGLVALQVLTARDGRRYVAGLIAAAGVWFVILYPNIAALPLPAAMVNAYQGLLPTYLYAFQFSVNTVDRSGAISFADPRFALLVVFLAIAAAVVGYATWVWRQALADEPGRCRRRRRDRPRPERNRVCEPRHRPRVVGRLGRSSAPRKRNRASVARGPGCLAPRRRAGDEGGSG